LPPQHFTPPLTTAQAWLKPEATAVAPASGVAALTVPPRRTAIAAAATVRERNES
jgi:hypothetical protein